MTVGKSDSSNISKYIELSIYLSDVTDLLYIILTDKGSKDNINIIVLISQNEEI